jgi:hypothetical protein
MAFEDKEAELGVLLTRMQNEPDDWHEFYEQVRLKLNELKAYGTPLLENLVQFERDLEAERELRVCALRARNATRPRLAQVHDTGSLAITVRSPCWCLLRCRCAFFLGAGSWFAAALPVP